MTTRSLRAALAASAFSLAVSGGIALAAQGEPTVAEPTDGNIPPGTQDNFDPTYNVCRGVDPRCYNPWVAKRQNKVLMYTRTAGPRHANLGPALAAGLNPPLTAAHVVQNALIAWIAAQGVEVHWTEDVTRLSEPESVQGRHLREHEPRHAVQARHRRRSRVRRQHDEPGAHLDAAKTALRQYIRAGGGFVGIHNAFGTEYNWPWYEGLLGNANYYDHGANQDGDVS